MNVESAERKERGRERERRRRKFENGLQGSLAETARELSYWLHAIYETCSLWWKVLPVLFVLNKGLLQFECTRLIGKGEIHRCFGSFSFLSAYPDVDSVLFRRLIPSIIGLEKLGGYI